MPYEIKDFELDNTNAFNVLVAYEDAAGGQRVAELLDRMTKAFPSEDPGWLRCAMWKFNDQVTPVRVEKAAEQATRADLIIIATHERAELPAVLEEWVRLWLLKKEGYPCALVALLERQENHTDSPRGIHSYFERMAQKAELAFFADIGNSAPNGAVKMNPPANGELEHDVSGLPNPVHRLRGSRSEIDFN